MFPKWTMQRRARKEAVSVVSNHLVGAICGTMCGVESSCIDNTGAESTYTASLAIAWDRAWNGVC